MKDRNGQDLGVGDKCVFIGNPKDREFEKYAGKVVIVRKIKTGVLGSKKGEVARVDDGKPEDTDICTSTSYTFSAWVDGKELAKV